jgi:probable H4MPT-linked C1 transfer pathway protein
VPCPLWRGLGELQRAVPEVLSRLSELPQRHAITMTGELADIFPDRNSGVIQIAETMIRLLDAVPRFYAGTAGLIGAADVPLHAAAIASANWLAGAEFVASQVKKGLLLDIGSTTSDLILLHDGRPQNRAYTDAGRMQCEELVYTGVVRTPLMALAERVPFNGEWQPLAAEFFATTADVYRLTGDLVQADDMADTADGAGKTGADSARRLARMLGHDTADASFDAWVRLAQSFKEIQLGRLRNAVMRLWSRTPGARSCPIIGAGCGSFLAAELARQLNCQYLDVDSLIQAHSPDVAHWARVCLPACAMAQLALDLP